MARLRSRPVAGSVTTIELFFDLVFVFTITQLTATLGQEHGWGGVGQVVLLLVLMWWMYGGYAWLTNAAPPVTPVRRALLLVGMVGYFTMALAIPHAYTTDRLVFALGYAVVVAVHTLTYLTQSQQVTPGMVVQLAGWNVVAVVLVVVGAVVGGDRLVAWWVVAVLAETAMPKLIVRIPLGRTSSGPQFVLQPAHFVERHGLMLLIVLGESVLAIGVGVSSGESAIGAVQVAFAAVSLGLAAVLYWAYFGTSEDHAAERALRAVSPDRQQSLALSSYGYAFVLVLLGVVFAAAGLHHALEHPAAPLDLGYAALLAGGVGVTWLGFGAFRRAVGRRGAGLRAIGGVVLVAATGLGPVSGFVELVALIAGSVAILLLERRGATVDPMDLDRARDLLTAERERLREQLNRTAADQAQDHEAEAETGDIDDPAQPLTEQGVDDAVRRQLDDRLAAVERAFGRLDDGSYGRSVRSGEPIPDLRLEADPAAELTVQEVAADEAEAR